MGLLVRTREPKPCAPLLKEENHAHKVMFTFSSAPACLPLIGLGEDARTWRLVRPTHPPATTLSCPQVLPVTLVTSMSKGVLALP